MTSTPERRRRGGDPTTLRADVGTPLTIVDGGMVDYDVAWAWQRDLAARRQAGDIGDVVLLVQHPPTYTLGRRADRSNLLWDPPRLRAAGIAVREVDRGGDITYHGPGQLVGYPVLELAGPRVVDYVRALEEVNIRVLARHHVAGRRIDGLTGVWTDAGKVTAIGVRVLAGRITQHGWATNVETELDDYAGIVPCGIDDRPVTSLRELGVTAPMARVVADTTEALAEVFGAATSRASASALDLHPTGAALVVDA